MPAERAPRATSQYRIGRGLFLRLLGLVHLVAFVSLWVQIEGLVGTNGILPVGDFLARVHEQLGAAGYFQAPTLLWLGSGDLALHWLCGAGAFLSLLLVAGVAPIPVLFLLWALYLSLAVGGQVFLGFQWDVLLLEASFCALFVAPARLVPRRLGATPAPPRAGLWLLWLLLFKVMFLSGAVKLLSFDATWWQLTALEYHYWTQPLPNGLSWWAHQLPPFFHKLSVFLTYAIEIVLPFLIFAGPRGRRTVAAGTIGLMLLISWTGNYGFFNLLTMVLAVPLIDDAAFRRGLAFLPGFSFARADRAPPPAGRAHRALALIGAGTLLAISAVVTVRELARTVPPDHGGFAGTAARRAEESLRWSRPILSAVAPFRTVNGYGLFRAMTTERPEIIIEGSRDGVEWTPYEFKWKPGDPARQPSFVAPHMPRLDWQMWFAALAPQRAQSWLQGLLRGLAQGTPEVVSLLGENPFGEKPPHYLRLVYWRYRFTTPEERREGGAWWTRERLGELSRPIAREQLLR